MKTRRKSELLLLLAAFIWGNGFVAQSSAMDSIGPWSFTWMRSLLAFLVLIPVAHIHAKRTGKTKLNETEKKYLLLGGVATGVILGCGSILQQIGVMYTTVGKASFLTALYCVEVPLFSIFFGKRVGVRTWVSVVLAVSGLYLLCMQGSLKPAGGDVCVLLCSIVFAFHILAIDYFAPRTDAVRMSCLQFLGCSVTTFVGSLFTEPFSIGAAMDAIVPLLYAGCVSMGFGYTLQIAGQEHADPTLASILLCLESVFGALAGFVLLHQAMSLRQVAGCALMFAATVLSSLPEKSDAGSK